MAQQLTGIRVYFRSWPEHTSGFRYAFECLYPFFDDLFFVVEASSQFQLPLDDELVVASFDRSATARVSGHALYTGAALREFATYVSDDWNGLVLTDISDLQASKKVFDNLLLNRSGAIDVGDTRVLFFHNFDGVFWQFFTNIDGVTDAMLGTHRKSTTLDLRHVDISLHYPDPGHYRDNFPPPVG